MSHISGDTDNHKAKIGLITSDHWGEENFVNAELVKDNLVEIKNKIAHYKARIIGVTKYFGKDAIVNGYNAGLRDFAESRALDAIEKIKSLPEEIRSNSTFHFIGHLQTNKAEKVVENFDYIHSIDSLKLARVVSNAACYLNKREKVLLQVNIAREEQKYGYSTADLLVDIEEILNLQGLEVVGLMCMAPLGATEPELRKLFSDMREYQKQLRLHTGADLPELSMGMSDDYNIAIEYGATMIRIGRKLFK